MYEFNVSASELDGHRFFECLSRAEKHEAARVLAPLNFVADDVIFKEGDKSDTCYIVVRGEVAITRELPNGEVLTFGTLAKGDVFGEMCLLTQRQGQRRSATARALSDGLAWRLYRAQFDRALDEGELWAHKIAVGFGRVLASRLAALDDELVKLIGGEGEAGFAPPGDEGSEMETGGGEAPSSGEEHPAVGDTRPTAPNDFDRLRDQLLGLLR
jgi:CRP-like cAMP-binding protein